jgi:S-adenosylmethionine:tRNA ribosyltransferase-isomerase
MMKLSDFDYSLPMRLIAQTPIEPRDTSRLMVVNGEKIEHKRFYDIVNFMDKGDVLILNNTKVMHAKLIGKKETGGKVEVLLIRRLEDFLRWECLVKGKNVRADTKIIFYGRDRSFGQNLCLDEFRAKIIDRIQGGRYVIEFRAHNDLEEKLTSMGIVPLPSYIKEELKNPERYQTVYAKERGAIAAPTAGLHFTERVLNDIRKKGVNIAYLTLHIGVGTFTSVRTKDVSQHKMDAEYYKIDKENTKTINAAKENCGKLIAVGTSTVRTLESACINGSIKESEGWTNLFVYPGYKFKAGINKLLTNFHLPKYTPIMLVSAFAGTETVRRAYDEAIKKEYRFYSFGDAMLISYDE